MKHTFDKKITERGKPLHTRNNLEDGYISPEKLPLNLSEKNWIDNHVLAKNAKSFSKLFKLFIDDKIQLAENGLSVYDSNLWITLYKYRFRRIKASKRKDTSIRLEPYQLYYLNTHGNIFGSHRMRSIFIDYRLKNDGELRLNLLTIIPGYLIWLAWCWIVKVFGIGKKKLRYFVVKPLLNLLKKLIDLLNRLVSVYE